MGSGACCRCQCFKCLDISKDKEIILINRHLSEKQKNLKVIKFAAIFYYFSSNIAIASNLVTGSKFIPGLNILTIPLSFDRDFAHAGLIIFCENNNVFYTHKNSTAIVFSEAENEVSAINFMNLYNYEDYPTQQKYAYYYDVKENIFIKDVFNFIEQFEKKYNLWSNNCQHYISFIINKFKK